MENVIKKLRLEFCLIFIWAAVLIGLFEWDVWTAGWAVGNELADYYINLTGIIMVIVLVPMALKVMSFRLITILHDDSCLNTNLLSNCCQKEFLLSNCEDFLLS